MLKDLQDLFVWDLQKLKNEISSYKTDSDLTIIRGTILNSPGNLCLHLCGNLQNYIGASLGNTGYKRDRDKEFSQKEFTIASLISEIDKTTDAINLTFSKLNESDLNNTYPETPYWKGFSVAQVLIICSNHFNYHLGQINYHRRLLESK